MASLHHFLSLVIPSHARTRSPRHFVLGWLLLLFRFLGVHSVVIIVHLLSLSRQTWPAHQSLPLLMVSTMVFTQVFFRIRMLLFLSRKARRCDSKPRTHIARDMKWWRSTRERYIQEEREDLWFGFGYLIFSKRKHVISVIFHVEIPLLPGVWLFKHKAWVWDWVMVIYL